MDIRNRRLVDSITNTSTAARLVKTNIADSIHVVNRVKSVYHNLLQIFPSVCRATPIPKEVRHSIVHCIHSTGPPVHEKARRVSTQMLNVAKAEFQYMMDQQGICRPSSNPWSRPATYGAQENCRILKTMWRLPSFKRRHYS